MSKVVAIMSMSLDGFVADRNDGVAEVFDWYFTSGEVEFHTGGADPMTFKVSRPSAEHLRGLTSELGAMLTGPRTFDKAGALLIYLAPRSGERSRAEGPRERGRGASINTRNPHESGAPHPYPLPAARGEGKQLHVTVRLGMSEGHA